MRELTRWQAKAKALARWAQLGVWMVAAQQDPEPQRRRDSGNWVRCCEVRCGPGALHAAGGAGQRVGGE